MTDKIKLAKAGNSKFLLAIALIGSLLLVAGFVFHSKGEQQDTGLASLNTLLAEPVSAKEIYPLFECPCCGKPISDLCCGMAKERKAYIDGLTEGQLSKEEIIAVYVKKYGLNSFIDKEKQSAFRQRLADQAPADRPIISLFPQSRDLEDVSQKQGTVFTFFELQNQGKSDLIIDRIGTSCGCTSAAIVFQGKEGPRFSMPGHGVNEKVGDWQVVIPAGQTAQLKVYYDPNVHPNFRGAAIRTISVFSNDPIDFEKKVKIDLNQVD